MEENETKLTRIALTPVTAAPISPKDGDVWEEDGQMYVYRDGGSVPVGPAADFVSAWNVFATAVHENAKEKGWWDEPEETKTLRKIIQDRIENESERIACFRALNKLADRNDGEAIALMHSELSESLEGLRHGNPPSDKIGDVLSASGEPFTQVEEELADVIIRIADATKAKGWDVGGAIQAKAAYNRGRSHKHGGKVF